MRPLLDKQECGRRDSNSYGLLPGEEGHSPADSRSAVYADFTTPALLYVLDKQRDLGDYSFANRSNVVGGGHRGIHASERISSGGLCFGGPPRRDYLIPWALLRERLAALDGFKRFLELGAALPDAAFRQSRIAINLFRPEADLGEDVIDLHRTATNPLGMIYVQDLHHRVRFHAARPRFPYSSKKSQCVFQPSTIFHGENRTLPVARRRWRFSARFGIRAGLRFGLPNLSNQFGSFIYARNRQLDSANGNFDSSIHAAQSTMSLHQYLVVSAFFEESHGNAY